MHHTFLKTKLHRATITAADPNYEGSVTIDSDLCRAAGLMEYEQVDVLDITNGLRFTTYVIFGEAGSGEVQVNGAAAQLVKPGDLAIIIAYCHLSTDEIATHKTRVLLFEGRNKIASTQEHPVRKP